MSELGSGGSDIAPAGQPDPGGRWQRSGAPILEFLEITKHFGGTTALDQVSLSLGAGEILALVGENGAGKSTLIKILAGVYDTDDGQITLDGAGYEPGTAGQRIAFIHQDLGLIDWMTVAENMALTSGYPRRFGLIDWPETVRRARQALRLVGGDIEPETRIQELSRTDKSLVAIARALAAKADILILDEPTASLPQSEVERLHEVLRSLSGHGVAMIYVSHRLDEVYALSDRVAVLRDGRLVANQPTADTSPRDLIRFIIGRAPETVFIRPPAPDGSDIVLSIQGMMIGDIGPVDLQLRGGEILGLAGLRGAGQDIVGKALFGVEPCDGGVVELRGRQPRLSNPGAAISAGICFVAGDRNADSIAHGLSVRENMFLNPGASGRWILGLRTPADEGREARSMGAQVSLTPNDPAAIIETLSGGNQQKVVIARWLRVGGTVLVLEDPTAGVDVGAKAEIYRLLAKAVGEGKGILLIATDFEEITEICHRALVFSQGRIVGELAGDDLTVERLLHVASISTQESAVVH